MPRTRSQPVQASTLNAFIRVSKAHVFDTTKKAAALETTTANPRKRKATASEQPQDEKPPIDDLRNEDGRANQKRACLREETEPESTPAPITKQKKIAKPVSRLGKTHRPIESTLISSSRRQTKIDTFAKKQNKATVSSKNNETTSELPSELAELVHLHKAFLKTTMIQLSHSRSDVPLDIKDLAPHIARAWGKRQVTVEDIRRCVAIQEHCTKGPFIVSDYGRGKVCIELRSGHSASAIKEDEMCRQFQENLKALCAQHATDRMTDVEVPLESLSLGDLPKAEITARHTLGASNPLANKGQQALSAFKNDLLTRQQEKVAQQVASSEMVNADGSKMSLLDRLRSKQVAAASAPAGPTGADIQRRAALNRVPEIAATISMLSLTNPVSLPRQAFTMAAIAEKLKDSLRVPMAREEGIECVRLIAKEIAPQWLRVVTIGGRENVVIQRNGEPVSKTIQDKVNALLG